MANWYVGIFLVIESMLVCTAICYELRKIKAIDAIFTVLVGRYAIFSYFWILLTIFSCVFIQVRLVLLYINCILLIVWFVMYLKNTPRRIKQRKSEVKEKVSNLKDEVKDGFSRK